MSQFGSTSFDRDVLNVKNSFKLIIIFSNYYIVLRDYNYLSINEILRLISIVWKHLSCNLYILFSFKFCTTWQQMFLQPQSNFALIFIGKERNKRIHSCLYMILVCQNSFTIWMSCRVRLHKPSIIIFFAAQMKKSYFIASWNDSK